MRAAALPTEGAAMQAVMGMTRGNLATRGWMSPLEAIAQRNAERMKDVARLTESSFYVVVSAAIGVKAIANRLKSAETYNRGADYAIGLNLDIVDDETRQEYLERKDGGEADEE